MVSLTVVFGLQMMRLLLPLFQQYLRDSVGIGSLTLAPIALGLFALGFLAPLVRWSIGARRAMWVTVAGLATARVIEQISTSSAIDFAAAAVGVVLFLWFVPLAWAAARARGPEPLLRFGTGFLLGMAFDTALFAALGTLDLSWRAGVYPLMLVVFLAAVLMVLLQDFDAPDEGDAAWKEALPLLAFGPWLLLQMLIVQNMARTAALTGWSLPVAAGWTVAGNAAGLALIPIGARTPRGVRWAGPGAALAFLAGAAIEARGSPAGVLILLALFASPTVFMLLVRATAGDPLPGLKRLGVLHAGGMMLFVVLAFLYYVGLDIALGFPRGVIPVAAGLLAVWPVVFRGRSPVAATVFRPVYALMATLFLIGPLLMPLNWLAPAPALPEPGRSVRTMTYNLHMGFDTAGQLSIERLARQIEASGADVVALQEVSRGYLTTGSLDMLTWLARRLGMAYVWGPTADAQWGNALLSRYPILEAATRPLPPDTLLLRRGYLRAEIDLGSETLTVIATHLHHRGDGSDIRQAQTAVLLDEWNNAPRTVLLGDLNATPDTPEIQMLVRAGLVSVTQSLPPAQAFTFPSPDPNRQIDYIWTSPDLAVSGLDIPQTTASDHLPIIVTVAIP